MPAHTITFPVEVLANILRQATLVPELLDTSTSIYFESRNIVIKHFHDSMKTKTFHNVMEIYLYEVVMIFRFQYIPILLQRLQSIPPRSAIPRGHRCRRLDFYLGVGDIPYNDEAWYEGGHTFWGLVPACPNLEILVARVFTVRLSVPRLTHKALWKTIATYCAKTIRRLELYGFGIRMDRVEMMLRYLTKLEACSIAHVAEFNPRKNTYDDEEPKKRVISLGSCYSSVGLRDDWDYTKSSGYFNASTVSKFKTAKENLCWPPFSGSTPYTLSHLHTLRLDNFDSKRITQFNFPHLHHLDMYCFSDTKGLSSSRGSFPDSLTHLTYSGNGASIAQIIGFFPRLRHLNLFIEYSNFPDSHFTNPHLCLEVVELATWRSFTNPQPQTSDIFIAARAGKLPSLRTIQVTRPWGYSICESFPFEEKESAALGIIFQAVKREKPVFLRMAREHHG
ncbi:hypothetical protein C0995_014217 [Termitomyces sp. Mi166|nr:hypothetical protein C0995_014217 [Termitomyces sp. Mi166\